MKRLLKIFSILGLLFFALSASAKAEDIELDKIVITPSRIEEASGDTSRKVDIITSKQLVNTGAKDLANALDKFPSVNISDYGGLGGSKNIRMRGSSAAQTLIMMDGRPLNTPRDGEADLSSIPLDNIERIEILHGPASSLYGGSAMGGAVNIITKKVPGEKMMNEFYSSFGTFRTYIERLTHGARIGKFGYLFSGSYESTAGFRANTETNSKDFNTKFEYDLNKENKIRLNSGFYLSKSGSPGPTYSFDPDDKQRQLKNYLDLTWESELNGILGVLARAYQNYDRLEFSENDTPGAWDTALSKAIHTTQVRGYEVSLNGKISDIYAGIVGFNYIKNMNDSTSTAKHKYLVRAGYMENRVDLFDRLNINFSFRFDDYSNFGTQFCPSLSLLYKLTPEIKMHFLAARSFRPPTFNDLYWPDEGWAIGNPNLNPEKGVTEEFGIEAKINKYIFTNLTYYHSNYKELINWAEDAGVWKPMNVSSAKMDGIELKNKLTLTDNFGIDLGYTYLRAKDAKTHKFLIYQPEYKVDLALKYKNPSGLQAEVKTQFTNTRYHDAANTIEVKRFFVFGLSVSKKFKDWITGYVSMNNFSNRKYQNILYYPMPGFSVDGGFKLEI